MTAPRRISELELHALVDGELTAEERAEVEALLAASPAEQALARDFRDLNQALRGSLRRPTRGARARADAGGVGARAATPVGAGHAAWPFAAALLIALTAGLAGYFVRGLVAGAPRTEPSFVLNAIGAHSVYLPEVRHPVEVKADEEHLIRWLTRRVGAPIRAPSLVDRGWKLMGGRLLPDLGLPAAQFMYEDAAGRRLTLYIRKETGLNNTSFQFAERDGLGSFYWIDRPLAYALAGRLSREELMTLADTVYTQLEQR
jgi:anti-sigma factor RsiW